MRRARKIGLRKFLPRQRAVTRGQRDHKRGRIARNFVGLDLGTGAAFGHLCETAQAFDSRNRRWASVTATLEAAGEDYRRQRWAYLEDVWEPGFHRSLVEQWPAFYYFEPIKAVTKGYDLGFVWALRDAEDPPSLDHFPALKAAYDHLRSPGFAARVTALAGDGVERACYQILLTRSFTGSSVIAHRDSNTGHHFTNMIFFLDGTGGPGSGGLGIWNDNEFRAPQVVPENLTNACLVYDMSAPFFHGFKPMRFGTHRWTINAAFRGAEDLRSGHGE